ncbi:hypothetical protein F5Y19DRAFT_481760 [Xylariaceae sp. FL1651]|nr:hypothetical protein F5Y19DRAFT_481760 [Xylariaceae sp. FL1651]
MAFVPTTRAEFHGVNDALDPTMLPMIYTKDAKLKSSKMQQLHSPHDVELQDSPSKNLATSSSSRRTFYSTIELTTRDERNDASAPVTQNTGQFAQPPEHSTVAFTQPSRPATRHNFEIAIFCALPLEADAVQAVFDSHWDSNGPPYDKASGDPNAYTTGAIGRHNVVLVHMPGMGKVSGAAVAASCRISFPSIKLAVVVGICGVVPFSPDGNEILLGDVIIAGAVIQYDFGRQYPDRFVRKETLSDSLSRPSAEIRASLKKLEGIYDRKKLRDKMNRYLEVIQRNQALKAQYPGVAYDRLFEPTYRHVTDGKSCDEGGCSGPLVHRNRLEQDSLQPDVHLGLIASGDTVMRSGERRDAIAQQESIIGFDMEGAGVWDSFPCVVIKGACDYADSHKTKAWQRYAAATAAACLKAFLESWVPSTSLLPELCTTLKPTLGPQFLVPFPRNENFVGRAAIMKKLQQRLSSTNSGARVSLFGLGGVGKTQIALEYAYRLREEHPDKSVFWVRASNAEQFRQSFHSIALECSIPGNDNPEVDMLPLVKRWLEGNSQGRWLMIIDNADDAQLFSQLSQASNRSNSVSHDGNPLGQYIPVCAHGSILATTRNKQAGLKFSKGESLIEICKMDNDESEQLLRSNLGEHVAASGDLLKLSSRLEHLPLALAQASAFIHENTMTIDSYIRLLDENNQNRIALLSEEFEAIGRDSGMSHAVSATWILTFEQIERQDLFASDLLSLMSLFDRQAIPMEFLSEFGVLRGEENIRLAKALGVLKAYSLVSEDRGNGLDMHRLVQLITQKWLSTRETMRQFAEEALLIVSCRYPFGNFENRDKCNAYLPHAQAVLELDSTGSQNGTVAKAILFDSVAAFFYLKGQWHYSEKLRTQAIEIRKEVQGPEHPGTLVSMANLASTYQRQGRWKEAESLEIQVLEMRKRILGPEHPDTLISMGDLASTYWEQGRWKEAESLDVQVLEMRKRILGPEHPGTLVSMANLASTYQRQGRWKEAESLEVQVLEMRKKILGPEHPDTLVSMANLASTYRRQGRWKEAESLEIQVLEMRKRILGPEHPDTLISMGDLASTYWEQGRWKEAESLEIQVLEMRKRILGPEHPDTLVSMANLASTYQRQGRWKEAESLEVQVLEMGKRILGPEHPNTLTSMGNLALTWKFQGCDFDAIELLERCAQARVRVLGFEHPDTQESLSTLRSWRKGKLQRWKWRWKTVFKSLPFESARSRKSASRLQG